MQGAGDKMFRTPFAKDLAGFASSGSAAEVQALSSYMAARVEQEVADRLDAEVQAQVEVQLQARVAQMEQQIQAEVDRRVATEVAEEIRKLLEEARLSRQHMFGRRSEAHPGQGDLFNEVEAVAAEDETSGVDAPDDHKATDNKGSAPAQGKRRGKRRPLPPELPRIETIVDVAVDERQCDCGADKVKIGEEVSEQLDIIPMQVRVIRTVRPRYACPKGERAPVVAPAPPRALPRSQFSAGFLAMLLTVKYVDGLPLNRFAKVLERHHMTMPRQSLARAVIQTAKVLQPLHNLCRDTLLEGTVIHMDETRVQVLKPPDKAPAKPPTSQSQMWVQRGGPPDQPVVIYDYNPSRSKEVPKQLLADWQGYLMTDGYPGYNAMGENDNVELLACMVHARRKFIEAQRAQSEGQRGHADDAIALFARLYAVEAEMKQATDEQRYRARQKHSVPILDELRAWLDVTRPIVTPKSRLGGALRYLDDYWPRLIRYTERGDLPIDNNPAENAIRPFVVGRKAWLFSDTPAGAHASAVIYSLVETVKANNLEPYTWFKRVLTELPKAKTFEAAEALLPWNLHAYDLAMELAD